jgi:hypothetical protein
LLQTLVEEVHKMTATAQKRKLRLKERSQKRKLKKGGKAGEEKVSLHRFYTLWGCLYCSYSISCI